MPVIDCASASHLLMRVARDDSAQFFVWRGTALGHLRSALGVFCIFIVVSAWAPPPVQPIAYSHKQHIALGLECLDCHSSADTGAAATLPSVRKCMLCHAKVAADKPEIQKLAGFAKSKREVPWQRVYGFPKESLVKFQHSPHIRAKIECI